MWSMRYALQDLPLLAELPVETLAELSAATWQRRYPAGQILCTEGDRADHLIVLLAGEVAESVCDVDGRELVLAVYGAPAGIGKVALLDSGRYPATVTARTAVEVCCLPREPLLRAVTGHPESAARLLGTLARMVRERDQHRVDAALLSAPTRVARWLVRRIGADPGPRSVPAGQAGEPNGWAGRSDGQAGRSSGRAGRAGRVGEPGGWAGQAGGALVALPGGQAGLGTELGLSRVTVNRALQSLRARGLIEIHAGGVRVLDRDGLTRRAGL
jgi:CRP/FNR family transcriptional regulator, cyclic AMP receptor protein